LKTLNIEIDEKTKKWIIDTRRRLHRYPELSFRESNTQKRIMEELNSMGIEAEKIAKTGVIATIYGKKGGKTIALRADMDALNMDEQETNLNKEYISQNKGVMHSCGHDGHMAMVLGAARLLQESRNKIKGNIRLIFQPGEETPPGGALGIIKEGGLEDVNAILGIHLMGDIPSGEIRFRPGKLMAHHCVFKITISGKGGHHLNPKQCIDPIMMVSEFISSIEDELKINLGPEHPFVLGFGTIEGGSIINQTPEEVKSSGTFRTFDEEDAKTIEAVMRRRLDSLNEFHKKKNLDNVPGYYFEIIKGYPVVANDEKFTLSAAKALKEHFPHVNSEGELNFGAEDFAYYLERVPGMFMLLGVRNPDKNIVNINHSNRFDMDEDVLLIGAKIFFILCMDFLKNHNEYLQK
jgi:amidohydrolase